MLHHPGTLIIIHSNNIQLLTLVDGNTFFPCIHNLLNINYKEISNALCVLVRL